MRQKGFTLIELMVVLSITAVLGILGIAGFTTYNQIQVLQVSASEVVTMLNLAKSRAQSQIKPSQYCTAANDSLNGYSVVISTQGSYTLKLRCLIAGEAGEIIIDQQNKQLPANLSFDADKSFFFPIQKGGVETAGQIAISGFGTGKIISVNSLGGVSIEPLPTATPTPVPPTPTPTPIPGLVAWWKMDGNANDSSGNGNNGTVVGAAPTADRSGQPNKAYDFESTESDTIAFGAKPSNENADYSLSVWVNYESLTVGAIYNDYFNTAGNDVIYIGLDNSDGGSANTLKFRTFTNGLAGCACTIADSGITPATGTWYHVVATYLHAAASENRVIKIYVDGVLKTTASPASGGSNQGGGNNFVMGLWNTTYLDGKLDDVRYYNRTLSAAEVTALYNE